MKEKILDLQTKIFTVSSTDPTKGVSWVKESFCIAMSEQAIAIFDEINPNKKQNT